jgi:murein L,D-transpeptidase YafK
MPTTASILRYLALAALLAVAGCNEQAYKDFAAKHDKQVSPRLIKQMSTKGMKRDAPIMARIFKEESTVEIWKQKSNGRYDLLATYDICKWSGKLGPKFVEGDRQAPEGFYTVRPAQMNPNSQYHLAFNIGYPNAFDRANGRTGSHLMVHGACSSSGCYSMTDPQMEEIYALGREAFAGGQTEFQIQAYPFRMTAANMARYKDDSNYSFWKNLKEGYDHFEITKVPPKVDVCERRYVFNAVTEGAAAFTPGGACPSYTQPEHLKVAYQSYQSKYDTTFTGLLGKGKVEPKKPSILGLDEAKLVSEWTKQRARGERVPVEPPALGSDGSVIQTTSRMGRIDSPAGRRMAEREAAQAEKARADEERALARAAQQVPAAAPVPRPAEVTQQAEPVVEPAQAAAPQAEPGMLGRIGKRFTNLFGG